MDIHQGDGTGATGLILLLGGFMNWLNENSSGVIALCTIAGLILSAIATVIKIRLWYKYKHLHPPDEGIG